MRDVEMPIGSIRDMDIAVWPVGVSDFVNFYVRRQNIYDYCVVERNYAGAELFSSDKLTLRRIHREEITFHADN